MVKRPGGFTCFPGLNVRSFFLAEPRYPGPYKLCPYLFPELRLVDLELEGLFAVYEYRGDVLPVSPEEVLVRGYVHLLELEGDILPHPRYHLPHLFALNA